MQKLWQGSERIRLFWQQHSWFQWLVATVIFLSMSWFYMGASLSQCSVATASFNSDSSGGIAWFQWASGNDLGWNYTTLSNYPVGEQLNRPQGVTSSAFSYIYRFLSMVSTPLCGLNLIVLLGYMSAALLMFGLAKWLTKSPGIGLFAGFAVAFVPYHQLKASSHIVYVYSGLFIAMVWAFLWFVQRPSYRRIAVVAATTALSIYFDGYFVLMAVLLLVSMIMFHLIRGVVNLTNAKQEAALHIAYGRLVKNIKDNFKYGLFLAGLMLIFLLPVVYTLKTQGSNIQGSLAAARGNIRGESITYGARPIEFVTPAFNNALVPDSYANWKLAHMHDSNPSENTLYVGLTVAVLALIGTVYVFRSKVRRSILQPNISYGYVAGLALVAGAVCLAFALPAVAVLFGEKFYMPTAVLTKFTATWRVFARLFLVIHPLLVLLAALGLLQLKQRLRQLTFAIFLGLCCLVLFLEFLPSDRGSAGNITKNTPAVYQKMATDDSVKVIAEYPLLDFLYTPSTFTFQQLHHKPVLNANDSATIRQPFNQSIAGLRDAQTIGVLKARGVTHVVSYGQPIESPYLTPYLAPDPSSGRIGLPLLYAYAINEQAPARDFILMRKAGFDIATVDAANRSYHVLGKQGVLTITPTKDQSASGSFTVSFEAAAFNTDLSPFTISQNNKVLWDSKVTNQPEVITFTAAGGADIVIDIKMPIVLRDLSAQKN